jgi:type I restriction enzyme S subunit
MRLADVCEVNPTAGRKLDRGQLCSFVPMEAVDEWSGSIVRRETRRVAEVSSGYTPFQDGDVLVAKITPCMENGKCALARNLVNGIGYGSTEFHVLRAGPEVLPEWLYYF